VATKLAGGAARPAGVWRLAWPALVANAVIGVVTIWLG
jgi:hypothetical protein